MDDPYTSTNRLDYHYNYSCLARRILFLHTTRATQETRRYLHAHNTSHFHAVEDLESFLPELRPGEPC